MLVIETSPGIKAIDKEAVIFAVLKGEFVVESCSMMNTLTMACLREVLIEHKYLKVHRNSHNGVSSSWFECIKEFTVTFQGRGSYTYEVGVPVDTFFKDILHAEEAFK